MRSVTDGFYGGVQWQNGHVFVIGQHVGDAPSGTLACPRAVRMSRCAKLKARDVGWTVRELCAHGGRLSLRPLCRCSIVEGTGVAPSAWSPIVQTCCPSRSFEAAGRKRSFRRGLSRRTSSLRTAFWVSLARAEDPEDYEHPLRGHFRSSAVARASTWNMSTRRPSTRSVCYGHSNRR